MPPPASLEIAHDTVVSTVQARLLSHRPLARLTGDRVYLKDAIPASPVLPYLVLSKGKNHGQPRANAQTTCQLDFRVESRDDHEEGLPLLVQAVQGALNGWGSPPALNQCILTDTGTAGAEDGYHARRDSFAAFHHDKAPEPEPESPADRSARLRAEADAIDAAQL